MCAVRWRKTPQFRGRSTLGNLLVEKKGAQRASHHLMVSAHMDEVGLIVTHVQDGGLLEIAAVGGVDASVVIGRQFLVGRQHIPGIVGTKPVHLLSKEQRSQLPTFDGLVLDIGASSAEEARSLRRRARAPISVRTSGRWGTAEFAARQSTTVPAAHCCWGCWNRSCPMTSPLHFWCRRRSDCVAQRLLPIPLHRNLRWCWRRPRRRISSAHPAANGSARWAAGR